eukprot:TRINITY_DN4865_c0_g2_i6.p1 TRINITY_DN4865_c0_g2~~TRINITY_DN4865_c0_g2_i6.p1  ORF type:complete len:324 (+),score=40.72 TRINITY_DN4865_c0_g2_i6:1129-2100(+)
MAALLSLVSGQNTADIEVFCAGGVSGIFAHSFIIKHRSPILFSRLSTVIDSPNLKWKLNVDSPMRTFELFLEYIYTGDCTYHSLNVDEVLELLKVSVEFETVHLVTKLLWHLALTFNEEDAMLQMLLEQVAGVHALALSSRKGKPFTASFEKINAQLLAALEVLHSILNSRRGKGEPSSRLLETSVAEESKEYYANFEAMSKDMTTMDFTIAVKGEEFRVHKAILMARTTYFENLLSTEMQEVCKNRVELAATVRNVDRLALLLKFCYYGYTALRSPGNDIGGLMELLSLAEYLGIKSDNLYMSETILHDHQPELLSKIALPI